MVDKSLQLWWKNDVYNEEEEQFVARRINTIATKLRHLMDSNSTPKQPRSSDEMIQNYCIMSMTSQSGSGNVLLNGIVSKTLLIAAAAFIGGVYYYYYLSPKSNNNNNRPNENRPAPVDRLAGRRVEVNLQRSATPTSRRSLKRDVKRAFSKAFDVVMQSPSNPWNTQDEDINYDDGYTIHFKNR